MDFTLHLFTKHGDFYVSDDKYGDERLEQIIVDDPNAEIIVEERGTHKQLLPRITLAKYLTD